MRRAKTFSNLFLPAGNHDSQAECSQQTNGNQRLSPGKHNYWAIEMSPHVSCEHNNEENYFFSTVLTHAC